MISALHIKIIGDLDTGEIYPVFSDEPLPLLPMPRVRKPQDGSPPVVSDVPEEPKKPS